MKARGSRRTTKPDPSEIAPPDDSGSQTFERYCYQAEVAFRFCLGCVLGDEIIEVIAEHIEDLVLHSHSGWRFLQIKTRNPERGPWKLTDLTSSSGALQSLARSYNALRQVDALMTFELYLEGAVNPKNDIQLLLTPEGRKDPKLIKIVASALKLSKSICRDFLGSVRVTHSLPARGVIDAWNIRLLGAQAGHLSAAVLEETYGRVVAATENAMRAAVLPPDWRTIFCASLPPPDAVKQRFMKKRLTKDALKPLFGRITSPPTPLLKKVVEPDAIRLSPLVEKLRVGGASDEIVEKAKSLRALASQQEYENSSARIWDDTDVLEDVRSRLTTRLVGIIAEYGHGKIPAASIWNRIVHVVSTHRELIDTTGFFNRDADLLVGEVCQMSDLCRNGWGNALA